MRRWPRPSSTDLVAAVLFALAIGALSGCSAGGFALGALSDRGAGKGGANLLVDQKRDTRVTLWLRDGSRVGGRYLGFPGATDSTAGDSMRVMLLRPPPAPDASVSLTAPETLAVRVDSIRRVSVPVSRGKVIGLFFGFFADVGLFFYYLSQMS